MEFKFAVQFNF